MLRLALRGLVPDPILDRPHPVGFAVPALSWLRDASWVDERVRALEALPCCEPLALRALRERLRGSDSAAWAAAFALWRWITLAEWVRAHDIAFD